jgi:hypothetical protein
MTSVTQTRRALLAVLLLGAVAAQDRAVAAERFKPFELKALDGAQRSLSPGWLAAHGFTVPVLLGGCSVQNDYRLVMTPTHYLLDARGTVLSRHAGYKAGDEKTLERDIQQALAR